LRVSASVVVSLNDAKWPTKPGCPFQQKTTCQSMSSRQFIQMSAEKDVI
jgi:hypothetical protein